MAITPQQKMSAARMLVLDRAPYFASVLLGMIPREWPGMAKEAPGPLGVTARAVLLWDPEELATWAVPKIAAALVHEVFHLIQDDAARARRLGCETDPVVALLTNLAADMANNDDIRTAGWEVGKDWLYPENIKMAEGLTAEDYYAKLRSQYAPPQGGRGAPGVADPGGHGAGGGPGTLPPPGSPLPRLGSGACGSCAGNAFPGEPKEGKGDGQKGQETPPEGAGEAPGEGEGRTPSELAAMRREVAQAVQDHVQKGRGNVPAGLARWAQASMQPPKVPWQTRLARLTRKVLAYRPGATARRYTWPSRRQGGYGFGDDCPRVPGARHPTPNVAVLVDTSGSMSGKQLGAALRETRAILTAAGGTIQFMVCDAAVHGVRPVRTIVEAEGMMKGGGGTDMKPGFEALAQLPRPPGVVVCATDGDIGDPGPPPPFEVIWLVIDASPHTFPFGTVIEVD